MTDQAAQGRALRPLWSVSGGALVSATATWLVAEPGPQWAPIALLVLGAAALIAALVRTSQGPDDSHALIWFAVGLTLVGSRGLSTMIDRVTWEDLVMNPDSMVRARVVVTEGWSTSRWGLQTKIDILEVKTGQGPFRGPGRGRIEVRGTPRRGDLPRPGAVVDILARPAGDLGQAFLVVPSARLVRPTVHHRLLPRIRNRLADNLMAAAGTNVTRIRTAELAAALALGRRDLVPDSRLEKWRRSGFAHLFAVSGLHVGIVGGTVWLLAALLGAGPRNARLIALVLIPTYAVLAGASPSAVRAALMGVIYLGARFLGRAVLPMAAVLLAALVLLLADPTMVAEPGFQLTVVVTAALIRWVPPVAASLRGPMWLTGAVAVPLVAQTAAAPLVSWHFRSLIPGAFISNIFALPLLAPVVLASVFTAVLAPLWPGGAALTLSAINPLVSLLDLVGGPARAAEMVAPRIPAGAVVVLVAIGWLALHTGRRARLAAAGWVALVLLLNLRLILGTPRFDPRVVVLPVSDGAAVVSAAEHDAVLADTGRYERQAAVLLADAGIRRLRVLIASHTDDDHIGGAGQVLRTLTVEQLVVPGWMISAVETVPLLRTARSAGTRVVPVFRGSVVSAGALRVGVLWPSLSDPPRQENERSLVARIDLGPGSALLTSDIGRSTERNLSLSSRLACDVLVIPHHGSRNGSSPHLLDSAAPAIALIPAAPGNTHGHPHQEVLNRLTLRGITVRFPAQDEAIGATWNGERWLAFP